MSVSKVIDLTGQRFGRLIALKQAGRDGLRNVLWQCRCDCGQQVTVCGASLRGGRTQSCGCFMRQRASELHRTHGHTRCNGGKQSPTYMSWYAAIKRTTNPNNVRFALYGGRGIRMCQRWRKSFANFLADMGERPEGTTLDRINNDGNYEPSNCRWASRTQQSRNQSTTKLNEDAVREIRRRVEAGEKHKDVARDLGIHPSHLGKVVRNETWQNVGAL